MYEAELFCFKYGKLSTWQTIMNVTANAAARSNVWR